MKKGSFERNKRGNVKYFGKSSHDFYVYKFRKKFKRWNKKVTISENISHLNVYFHCLKATFPLCNV